MPRSMAGKGRHVSYNADGELCMTVVDPVTRKLLIPTQYIFDTRAQQRSTLPSLCQLFLSGRCRQGQGCYQVHADWEAVQRLRSQVDSLPCCCPGHGDKDHLGLMDNVPLRECIGPCSHHHANGHHHHHTNTSPAAEVNVAAAAESSVCARDVVVYVPGCSTYEGSYVPLERISFTVGLRRLLEEQQVLLASPNACVSLLNPETGFPEDKVVADASGSTVCRLHAMDRCRYAEECKFLHLCKELTTADPQLTASPAAAATAAIAECAGGMPEASFDTSMTSAGMSATTAMAVSTNSIERRGKVPHGSAAGVARQSVFTSVSLQQQQQQPSLSLSAAAVMSGSLGGRPLLVPQREEAGSATRTSKGLPCYQAPANPAAAATATPPCPAMLNGQPSPDAYMNGGMMGRFSGSYPAAVYQPGSSTGRIRVALSLPTMMMTSPPSAGCCHTLGTSNSSEKTTPSPTDDSLGAVGCARSPSSNGFPRTDKVSYGASTSSQPVRWHHNPYMSSSISRCDQVNAGSCGSYSSPHMYPSPNGLFNSMPR